MWCPPGDVRSGPVAAGEGALVRIRSRIPGGAWGEPGTVTAGGTAMFSVSLGPATARTVVCVHGLGCSSAYFGPLARALVPHARVVAVDLPGFGRTPGPSPALDVRGLSLALADWLRASGNTGALLLGHSLGCQVVVDLAVHAPGLFAAAVLAGPTVDRRGRSVAVQGARLARDLRHERLSLVPLLARDYVRCGPRQYAQSLRASIDDRVEDKLGLLSADTVVVRGARDAIVTRKWAQEVVAGLPRGRLVEVPGCGHNVNYSAPEALAAVVRLELANPRAQ